MNRMNHLSEHWREIERIQGETNWLKQCYEKIFSNYDPFAPVFATELLSVRVVLFPTDSYHLTESQFQAISAAIETREDRRFYISEIGWSADSFQKGHHYLCFRPSFGRYTRLGIGVENAIYGADGSWGILLSDELHAFLACDERFWKEFSKHYPDVKTDRAEFLDYWEHYKKEDTYDVWLRRFLSLLNR